MEEGSDKEAGGDDMEASTAAAVNSPFISSSTETLSSQTEAKHSFA